MKKFVSMKEGNMSKCLNDETKFEKFIVVVMVCENPLSKKNYLEKNSKTFLLNSASYGIIIFKCTPQHQTNNSKLTRQTYFSC